MARGNRRGDIVLDDTDRRRFLETLEEVVEASGWVLFGWVLMRNHYHLLFKTPEPNLVKGMGWFQNTWTRRFNTRHKQWGRLYGDRYKAKPVEEGEYLTRLLAYIHLNPVRAGLVKRRQRLDRYPWSSLGDYLKPPRKRSGWVAVERALRHMEIPDTAAGRRRFIEWLEGCIDWKHPGRAGDTLPDGQSLQSTFKRGWYFGSEAFREKLLELLGSDHPDFAGDRQKGRRGAQTRDHGEAEARRVITIAQREFGLKPSDWAGLKKGDWRKGVVAGAIRRRSLVDNGWLAEQLHMGARNAVSHKVAKARAYLTKDRQARQLAKRFEQQLDA